MSLPYQFIILFHICCRVRVYFERDYPSGPLVQKTNGRRLQYSFSCSVPNMNILCVTGNVVCEQISANNHYLHGSGRTHCRVLLPPPLSADCPHSNHVIVKFELTAKINSLLSSFYFFWGGGGKEPADDRC